MFNCIIWPERSQTQCPLISRAGGARLVDFAHLKTELMKRLLARQIRAAC